MKMNTMERTLILMTEPKVIIDMTNARRRKRGSKKNIQRYWSTRYNSLLKVGFNKDESAWGADNGVVLKSKRVRGIMRLRQARIELYTGPKFGMNRGQAISKACKSRMDKIQSPNTDPYNIFYEDVE